MSGFSKEQDFDKYFYALNDPKQELKSLAEWRVFQIEVVSKFIQQIRLIANDQYSNLDHFLLELLQNADDNVYADSVVKTLKLTLTEDSVVVENNEIGFSAENLYAITYSGASTKNRVKTSRTYIGEKGIGFKSVFAVAEYVEIHSPPYHFRLNNDEYIVPHPIDAEPVEGTRFVLKFKTSGQRIREILDARFRSLAEGAQEFTLFLQQLERLELKDQVSGYQNIVQSVRDENNRDYVIRHEGHEYRYIKTGYPRVIPLNIARTRFDEITSDVEREITFAVPLPPVDGAEPQRNGVWFCYLPTRVSTGLPIHIQIDAKTTTNRENIQPFANSDWNRCLFQEFAKDMMQLYLTLSQREEFKNYLPAYWPHSINNQKLGNDDLVAALAEVESELGNYPIILDRHGVFKYPHLVKIAPVEFDSLLHEDKYEHALTEFSDAKDRITFLNPVWLEKYEEQVSEIGVEYLDNVDLKEILKKGPPDSIDVMDDHAVRLFLSCVLVYSEKNYRFQSVLAGLPIFPVLENGKRTWQIIGKNTMWLQTDSARVPEGVSTVVIDPVFTYSPGGGQRKDEEDASIRVFNQTFRDFLKNRLNITAYSEEELILRSIIPELKSINVDISKTEERSKVVDLWRQLYVKIWNRQKTIAREKDGEKLLNRIFVELGKCKVPVKKAGTSEWQLAEVCQAFLGYPFHKEVNLSRVYAGTGAPIIVLDLQNRTRKKKVKQKQANVDWEQWKEFLIKCGAKTGPFWVQVDVTQKYTSYWFNTEAKKEDSAFLASIKQEIKKHREFTAAQETNFRLYPSYSVSFDPFTSVLIAEKRNNQEIVKRLDSIFHSFNDKKTSINFIWGQKQNLRQVIVDSVLAAEQLENGLMIASNQGMVLSQRCYVNNSENKRILSHLVPLVDDHKYSPVFLKTIGVKETVSVSDLQALIAHWYLETEQKSIDGFLPYVEMVISYLNLYPKDEHKINLHIQLFDPENDLLIKIDDWLKSACNMGFSESIVKRLANALSIEQTRTPEQLLDTLFDFEDISSSPESLLNVLVDIGSLVQDKESQLKELFVHKLATQGLMYSGHKITTTDELPFIWDQFPVPKSNSNLIVCRPTRSQAKKLQFALEEFEWTCLSQSNPEIHFGEEIKISDVDCRRVYLSMSEVISSLKGDRPSLAQRVEKLGLFSDKDQIQSKIYRANNLKVIFSVNGKTLSIYVPYWFSKEKLAIDSEHDISIEIPRFVDEKTGTTFKALFRYIWEAKEKESRVYGAKGDEGDINQPPKYTGGNHTGEPGENGTDNGSKSDLDDNIFDDEKENNDSEDGLDTGNSFDPNNPSRRKRIHSVSLCTHSRKGNGLEKQFAHQHNQKVEEAGRKRLIAYLKELGAEVISRESENVGYDFEVSIGDEAFYIELKSSQDQWVGWEHTLSANEFKKALELKDKYFLCAIDYSFNDEKYQFYFIQNPAENVDYFAFDSPWKALSLSMNAYISRLKDKQGMAA